MAANEREGIELLAISSEIFAKQPGYYVTNSLRSTILPLVLQFKFEDSFCRF
jgi:hypothetical protein